MQSTTLRTRLRDPASAAVAGIIFAAILLLVLVQFHTAVPAGPGTTAWLADESHRRSVSSAVGFLPFAGIAFLWFIGVVRTRLGDREDRLFSTVFLGSGLLFVAMVFAAGAILATVLILYERGIDVEADSLVLLVVLAKSLMGLFGTRMTAVFTLSVTSIALRSRLLPIWLVGVGYLAALLLLISPLIGPWAQLAFPLWVMLFSGYLLVAAPREVEATN